MNTAQQDLISKAPRMPALFIGHGSPMNAIEDSEFSREWAERGQSLKPKAILCISAHWETRGSRITAMPQPKTLHDFYGFPKELFDFVYPAPGSPELAARIQAAIPAIELDSEWGLDHGSWSILCHMFPKADIPVLQLSLDRDKSPLAHYQLGRALSCLRDEGVLIVASGNIVHNLRTVIWQETAHDWAIAFAEQVKQLIANKDQLALIDYPQLTDAALAIPTPEHYLPLLYILGLQDADDVVSFFNDKTTLGAISMLSIQVA